MSSNNLFSVFQVYADGMVATTIATGMTYEQALSYCKHSGAAIENLAIRRSEPSGAWVIPEDDFTDDQEKLIELLIKAGFGYAKFAESVKKQGKCSARQEEVMRSMLGKLRANAR